MWLSLIPQIHSPGDSPDLSMRHHHFIEDNPQFYDGKRIFCNCTKRPFRIVNFFFISFRSGKIRLQSLVRPTVVKTSAPPLTTATPKHKTEKTPSPIMPSMTTGEHCFFLAPSLSHGDYILNFFLLSSLFTMPQNVHRIQQSFQR